MKIKILNTDYDLFLHNNFKELNENAKKRDERYALEPLKDFKPLDGYCDYTEKEIHIFVDKYTKRKYFEMTLYHELTHAFLYEIGYSNHDDEDLVDKISKWVPLITDLFNESLGVIRNARTSNKKGSKKNDQQSIPDSK